MALIDDDRLETPALPAALDERPRALLDVAAECIGMGAEVHRLQPHHHDWPRVVDVDSGYARLARWVTARMDADAPDTTIDLSTSILDRLGPPAAPLDW